MVGSPTRTGRGTSAAELLRADFFVSIDTWNHGRTRALEHGAVLDQEVATPQLPD